MTTYVKLTPTAHLAQSGPLFVNLDRVAYIRRAFVRGGASIWFSALPDDFRDVEETIEQIIAMAKA